jgi:hypothetical protein
MPKSKGKLADRGLGGNQQRHKISRATAVT